MISTLQWSWERAIVSNLGIEQFPMLTPCSYGRGYCNRGEILSDVSFSPSNCWTLSDLVSSFAPARHTANLFP
jgi:hypothetical protein